MKMVHKLHDDHSECSIRDDFYQNLKIPELGKRKVAHDED